MSDYGWTPKKCWVVAGAWSLVLTVVLIPIWVTAVVAARNADYHREQVIKDCVQSGQSWVSGNCVRASVVHP